MKNKNFYNVVNKTKLIDVFKKNKVMMNTYFGQLPSTTGLYLDFTNEDTFNELVNAPGWVASEEHTDFTLYRRADNFTQALSTHGTTLYTTGTAKTDRYGLTITGSKTLGNKFMYEANFQLNWNGEPVEASNRTLLAFFFREDHNTADHTRVNVITNNGSTSISIEAITQEGSTSRTTLTSTEFAYNTVKKLQVKYDLNNHTIEMVLDGNSLGVFAFYGGSLGSASIAGTSQASYKPNTNLLIKDIKIKEV